MIHFSNANLLDAGLEAGPGKSSGRLPSDMAPCRGPGAHDAPSHESIQRHESIQLIDPLP